MKIREIMKRTMAIGLAVAMLLQSRSVVTLAETVQTDAAETVVVDVGEETSVSGNGNDESEVDFSYEQGVPNEYTNRTILSENDVNIVEIDDDGYVYDESFYDDIEAEESSADEVKSAITNYVSQLNGKFPTNYKNKAWQCYAFCNYVVSNVMGIDFFSNCITKKNGKWQSTDKLVEFLNKYAKPGDNIWGKGGHNMILMGWTNQGLYITDGMKNGNVWHNNKFISFSGKEWKNNYYSYFSAGYRLYSINSENYKVINYGSNPVDKPPVINIAPAKPEVGAIAVSRSQDGEISYSAPVGVGAGASSGIVTISNSSGESYEHSCAIVNGQISGVVQIGHFQNTNTIFSIRVTVTDSYGCRAENMTQIDNTTTYTINATELTLKVGESFQFQGTTNTNLKVISEAWDYSTSTSDGEKRFGLQITPTGYVTAEKPGTYTVNYDSVIEQTSGGSTVQTKHRCSCVLKVYLDTPVINNVEFVNNRVEIDFVPISGAEGYYIVWSEGENGSTNEKYKPNSIDKGLLQKGLDTGDIWVNGTKYRKISCNNTTDAFNYNTSSIQSSKEYRYFKWERIRWRVLETVGGKMKLMADMALDCQPYNVESKEITWKESTIRSWLNSYDESQNDSEIDYTGEGFINTAFSGNERDALIVNEITDKAYGDDEGSAISYVEGNANDKVGLLSKEDAFATEKYGFCIVNKKSKTRCLEPTPYAYVMGCATYSLASEDKEADCFWWTRSTYNNLENTTYRLQIDCYGNSYNTIITDTSAGVVPVITINMKDRNWKLEDDETSGNAGENDPYYPIEYNLDGGNNSLKNPSSYRLNRGLIELENPQKMGYQFKGWYTDKELKKQIKCIDTSTAGKIKLYAQWEKVNNNIDALKPASTSVYTYEVLSDGTIRITSCQTSDVNLVIPDTIDGYVVTEIGTSAFANQTSIQTVKFPANLKQIGVKAFANCTGLLEVTLSDTIQGAGQLCFSGCTALKKAVLNKGRINIVYGMFENCTSLTEVVIPDTVENVAMYAFLNCRSLTHLNLPASLKSISVYAFEGAGVTTITYAGTKAQWQKVKKNLTGNGSFVTATVTDSTGVSFTVSGSNNGNQNPQQVVKKPAKVKITKAKNVKTKKLTVKWKKTSKAKGYQIQIASNKKFTKGKKTKTLSKTIFSFKKLKKNKYYYVRVRAYVYNSNHKKVYGSWSTVKKVKIKK